MEDDDLTSLFCSNPTSVDKLVAACNIKKRTWQYIW